MVMGGRGFESLHHILDGHFSRYFGEKYEMFIEKSRKK